MATKKNRGYSWLLWPIIIFILGGAVFYFFLNPKLALDLAVPEFNKIGFISAKVEDDKLYINSSLVLTNKSPYSLEIDTITLELKIGGKTLIKKTMVDVIDLKKRQTDTIPISLLVNLSNFRNILNGLKGQDSTDLELSVTAEYNTFLGHVSFPYTTTKTIAVPVPPKLKVVKLERHKFRFSDKTLDADVHLQITNGGNLNLNIDELQYHLFLEHHLVEAKGIFHPEVVIKPHSEKIVVIPVKIKIDRPLKVYLMVLRDKDDVPYTLRIKANVDEHTFIKQSAPVEFVKTGVMELKKDKEERPGKEAKK